MRVFCSWFCLLLLASCGYVGPVQPPSPEIPGAINDLVAMERGDKIIVTFSTPARTTDGVAIGKFSRIDLRIGPESQPIESAKSFEVEPPPPHDREDPQPEPMSYALNPEQFSGQRVAVEVRTAVKKNGHFSAWSNRIVFTVVSPVPAPVLTAQPSAQGIVLTWPASAASEYRVQRQGLNDKEAIHLGIAKENRYVDSSALYDTEYRYVVTAVKEGAESLPSEPVSFSYADHYPPMVPTGLTALVGPDSIELAWQRDTEPDLQGYYLYRSVNNGSFQRLGDLINVPTFTDKAVEHGRTYTYKASAVDKKNNESGQSNAAEVLF